MDSDCLGDEDDGQDLCDPGFLCQVDQCVPEFVGSGWDGAFSLAEGAFTLSGIASPIQGVAGESTLTLLEPDGFEAGDMLFLHRSQGDGAGDGAEGRITMRGASP